MVLIAVGVCYLLWLQSGYPGIACPFYTATGLKCPGCGVTTMIVALSLGKWVVAWQANPFLLASSPFLLAELGWEWYRRHKEIKQPKWNQSFLYLYLVLFLAFGILRNIF